ncbi:MAG: ester cyclase [Chloroflexota bacterium]|nr:ester cyclase [Chloroflexota bacterium]
MGACIVRPRTCAPPTLDDPTDAEKRNADIVREFIRQVWNYRWTDDDERRSRADPAYLPPSVRGAIRKLVSPRVIRHRFDDADMPRRGDGQADFEQCIRDVHAVCTDLQIQVVQLMADGNRVMAVLVLTGTDRRADGNAGGPGVLDRTPASGREFRSSVAATYRLSRGRIVEDWSLSDQPGLSLQIAGDPA